MLLQNLEKMLRGNEVTIEYKDFRPQYTIVSFTLKVYEIKDLPSKYLNAQVLRINLDDEIPSIFIEMN